MHFINFSSSLRAIDRSIELTKFKLEYDNRFPDLIRIEFNQALENLLELLQKDQKHVQSNVAAWHTAYRIVHLNKIQAKLEQIRKKIFEVAERPYFVTKIQSKVIPPLKDRIKELKTAIEAKGRLPFSTGVDREQYFEDVKAKLKLKNIQEIFEVEKEYFHILGNHFDEDQLKDVDIDSHNGSLEIKSFISWKQVLKLFIQEGDASEKQVGSTLLSMIKEAIPFSLKTSFAYGLNQVSKPKANNAQEMAYFEDYLQCYQPKRSFSLTQFHNKYQLGHTCPIPESVIINEIAWDMLETVSSLKKGGTKIFPLGTRAHCIAVQVTCTQDSSTSTQKKYEYKIFNTGEGVSLYHQLDQTGKFARPVIYKDLPPSAFSYSFFANLLRISLEKPSVDEFYQWHNRVLVNEAGGKKDTYSGPLYFLQLHDTCTYSAVEAWIYSYLSEQQIKHFDVIKAKVSTNKQEEVVRILGGKKRQKGSNWKIAGKRKIRPSYLDLDVVAKKRKLKESEILLDLGNQFLQQAVKNFPVTPVQV